MNKVLGIIGAVFLIASVVFGCFCKFPYANIAAIAAAAFGFTALVVAEIKKAKEENRFGWKTVVVIVLAAIGGVLICLGGAEKNVIEAIIGAVVALVTVIFGVVGLKLKKD